MFNKNFFKQWVIKLEIVLQLLIITHFKDIKLLNYHSM